MSSTTTPPPTVPTSRRSGGWKHLLKRTLQALAGLLLLLVIVGASYEFTAEGLDARRFPQQGKSIRLGSEFQNVSLNLNCSGPGASDPATPGQVLPTVILDSGLGVPAIGWKFVQDEVAHFTHVCSYDRAGYGWSAGGPQPRTSMEIAKELHALLAAAGEKGPFVIVGHSFGGYNVRVYTGQYPSDVVGMVLVDASHEDQGKRIPAALSKPPSNTELTLANVWLHLGVTRLLEKDSHAGNLPREFAQQLLALKRSAKSTAATRAELQSVAQSAEQVRAAGNLGDRPLVVLTAGKVKSAADLPPGTTQKELDDEHKIWTDFQVSEMHLSTRGTRTIVADSGHMIPFERPNAITAAIREVCEAARGGNVNAADLSAISH
jgi:pimeloyl-ACP methyl ester carboxylesterase